MTSARLRNSGGEDLFRSLYPSLRRYAAVVGSLSDDPDDLVQEALARTLAVCDLGDLENPGAYLRRAIANLAINGVRADVTRRRYMSATFVDRVVRDVYPSDLDELRGLSPMNRGLMYLVDVEGMAIVDAADVVGVSAVAARLRVSRARRFLRQILEEDS